MKTQKIKTQTFKLTLLAGLLSVWPLVSQGSRARADIDYQYYRDLAENKGQFTVGASNITIYNTNGESVGTMLPNIPMPDLSAASRVSGFATLVGDQFIASVAHNTGYTQLSFGASDNNPDSHYYNYQLTNRNNYPGVDYQTPRLHKLVTEVAPTAAQSLDPTGSLYFKGRALRGRYTSFLRVGGGHQYLEYPNNSTKDLAGAYQYLTGGVPMKPFSASSGAQGALNFYGNTYSSPFGPMGSFAEAGDSGSGLYAWDSQENQWIFVGVLRYKATLGGEEANGFMMFKPTFLGDVEGNAYAGEIYDTAGKNLTWDLNADDASISHISGNGQSVRVDLANASLNNSAVKANLGMDNGKTVYFYNADGATLTLNQSIDQGAGALYFNNNITVQGANENVTWTGGGISVYKDEKEEATVTWKVANPQGDRLSKIGGGTLLVNGSGVNQGSISVGDGTVILAQQANATGEKQAFREVGIVSGRATVVLNDGQQVDPNNIYFGFRGGRLDVNGNDLSFRYIQNTDQGAQIVNHNAQQAANITVTGKRAPSGQLRYVESDLVWKNHGQTGGDIYEYRNQWQKNRLDYFVLKGNASRYFPTNGGSDANWEYLGSNKATAVATVLARKNATLQYIGYNGYFGETDANLTNGALNVNYRPEDEQDTWLLSGGTALNGNLNVHGGTLVLSGRPTPHAYDVLHKTDVMYDNDWINRTFNATQINVNGNATLYVNRNVAAVNANFSGADNATLSLGFIDNHTPVCVRSDYTGNVNCKLQNLSDNATIAATVPKTALNGNITLRDHSRLELGKAVLTGEVHGTANTPVSLSGQSEWVLTGNSEVGSLTMAEGAKIRLNPSINVTKAQTNDPQNTGGHSLILVDNNASNNVDPDNETDNTVPDLPQENVVETPDESAAEASNVETLSANETQSGSAESAAENTAASTADDATLRVSRAVSPTRTNDAATPNTAESAGEKFNVLRVFGDLSGKGEFYYLTDIARTEGDKVLVLGNASGEYLLRVQDSGSEPLSYERLNLLEVRGSRNNLAVSLANVNEEVDLGAYRYKLVADDNGMYRLYSPLKEQEIAQERQAEAERLAEQARQAELARQAAERQAQAAREEADRLAEAARQAETARQEAARQAQLAAEQRAEAARLEAERLARLAREAAERAAAIARQAQQQAAQPQKNLTSKYGNTALSDAFASSQLAAEAGAGISRHLGALAQGRIGAPQVWLNVEQQRGDYTSDQYRDFHSRRTQTQLGVDLQVDDHWQFGAALTQARNVNDFAEASGKNALLMGSLYAKYRFENGVFVAVDGGAGRIKNDVQLANGAKFHRTLWQAGALLGKDWQFGQFEVKPMAGVRYQQLSGAHYSLDQAQIEVENARLRTAFAGLGAAYRWDFGAWSLKPALSAYVSRQSGKDRVRINQRAFDDNAETRQRYAAGLEFNYALVRVQLQSGVTQGQQMHRQYFWNTSVSWAF